VFGGRVIVKMPILLASNIDKKRYPDQELQLSISQRVITLLVAQTVYEDPHASV
jgi:hypothetical protein